MTLHTSQSSPAQVYISHSFFYVRDIQLGLVVIRVNYMYVHHYVFEKRKTKLSVCVVTGEEYTEEGVCRLCGIDALSQLLGTYTVYTVAIQLHATSCSCRKLKGPGNEALATRNLPA